MQVMGTARRRSHGLLVAAVVLWLGTVAALAAVRAATGWDAPGALAASPEALAGGRLLLLAARGLIVQGAVPALQLAAAALLAWGVLRRLGAATFWIAAVAGHVGATLLTYGAIGALWLAAAAARRPVSRRRARRAPGDRRARLRHLGGLGRLRRRAGRLRNGAPPAAPARGR